MKKFIVFLFLLAPLAAYAEVKTDAYVFTAPTCVHCLRFHKELLPELKNKYAKKINFIEVDTSKEANGLKLLDLAEKYEAQPAVPAFVVGEYFLIGYPSQIGLYAEEAIQKTIASNITTLQAQDINAEEKFKSFTLAAILLSGLADGVNPCAFAVIVFFISFLSVYGYNRKEVIYVGSAYCFAVFVTYVLLGLGLFNVLYALNSFQIIIKTFYILTALACFLFFGLSVYDLIIYQKTKDSKAMLLRLPDNLKIRINKIIGFFMRDKEKSTTRLIIASLCVGFIVSLVEAVCTGQIYIPTIVLIMKEPSFRLRAFFYLILYNIMFIMPLLLVFIISAAGQKSEKVNNFFKKHLGIAKFLLSLVFLGLGLMLILNI